MSTADVSKLEIGSFDNVSYLDTHGHVTVEQNPRFLMGLDETGSQLQNLHMSNREFW